jgi:hypothetical protein
MKLPYHWKISSGSTTISLQRQFEPLPGNLIRLGCFPLKIEMRMVASRISTTYLDGLKIIFGLSRKEK